MPSKKELIKKLFRKPYPKNFTVHDLDMLMNKCDCIKKQGGRGSSVKYIHEQTKQVLQFDIPHPGKDLYKYHIDKVKKYIEQIDEKES